MLEAESDKLAGAILRVWPATVGRDRCAGNSGDVYEQAVVKTVAGFFRGNPKHLFGVTRFGAPGVYVRAGSSHLNEVAMPQSP